MLWDIPYNDEGGIGILENMAGEVIDKRVEQESIMGGMKDKLL
jgi:hypothetical protein